MCGKRREDVKKIKAPHIYRKIELVKIIMGWIGLQSNYYFFFRYNFIIKFTNINITVWVIRSL